MGAVRLLLLHNNKWEAAGSSCWALGGSSCSRSVIMYNLAIAAGIYLLCFQPQKTHLKASQQQQALTPLSLAQSEQQQKAVGQQKQHTLVALQRQNEEMGQKQLHKSQRQTTSSDPQQDKLATFVPLKCKEMPVMSPPALIKPPFEKRVANAPMGATKLVVISRNPPTLTETTTLNKIPNENLVTMNQGYNVTWKTHHLKVKTSTKEVVEMYVQLKQYLQDLDIVRLFHWPEHVKFDEKEEAIAFAKHGFISE
ncbi:Leucine--tRNA ligase [Bienertia sinuspersici]